MTSYYIVYNFTVSLKPLEIIQSFQRNFEKGKHLFRWANMKKLRKPLISDHSGRRRKGQSSEWEGTKFVGYLSSIKISSFFVSSRGKFEIVIILLIVSVICPANWYKSTSFPSLSSVLRKGKKRNPGNKFGYTWLVSQAKIFGLTRKQYSRRLLC